MVQGISIHNTARRREAGKAAARRPYTLRMLKKFFRRLMPDVDKVREIKGLGVFGERLFHPALWQLQRRSAAGGVAVGLFCGLIPGPLQMLGAAVAALVLRVNLPLALVTTLYTNPVTIVPLYLLAYQMGRAVLGGTEAHPPQPPPDWVLADPVGSMQALGQWVVGLGAPLALGVVLLASMLSASGYVLVRGLWSLHLRHAARARKARRGPGPADGGRR
jgi:hypothetical protein